MVMLSLQNAEAIRFEIQVVIACDDDRVGCYENVVNESNSKKIFGAILEIQEEIIIL